MKNNNNRAVAINSQKLDKLYKEWSGEHHTTNSNKPTHDSAECTDFAKYCLKYAVSDGEMIPTRDSNCNIPLVIESVCLKCKVKMIYNGLLNKHFCPNCLTTVRHTIL